MLSTIALLSSARRHGNTGQFTDRIASRLAIEVVDLTALRIAAYDYAHASRDDDFEPLMQRVLEYDQIIFASPIYWYAVSPALKIFLDRISDLLELPDLLAQGRRLRGKMGYVVCTSVGEEPSAAFLMAFRDTFDYLGMHWGGLAHVNCDGGRLPTTCDLIIRDFAARVREATLSGPTT
jgi:multimeric flavodoxin WrbA